MKLETDRSIPITPSGPDLGVSLFDDKSTEHEFMFVKGKSRVNVPLPTVVRINRQGGSYSMLEFFYHPGQGARAMDLYDGKDFVLVSLKSVKEGRKTSSKKTGTAYRGLVCTGKLRDSLAGHPNIRFDKFVCQTEGMNSWNDISKHFEGLGAPVETA